jgi:hypothetical protein
MLNTVKKYLEYLNVIKVVILFKAKISLIERTTYLLITKD